MLSPRRQDVHQDNEFPVKCDTEERGWFTLEGSCGLGREQSPECYGWLVGL